MNIVFLALTTFESLELRSIYTKGLTYTSRPADDPAIADSEELPPDLRKRRRLARTNRAKLRELLPTWVSEGKIAMGGQLGSVGTAAGSSGVAGEGEVR